MAVAFDDEHLGGSEVWASVYKGNAKKKAYAYRCGCIYTSNSFFFIEGYATIATEFLIGLVEEDAGAYAGTREELPRSLLAQKERAYIYKLRRTRPRRMKLMW